MRRLATPHSSPPWSGRRRCTLGGMSGSTAPGEPRAGRSGPGSVHPPAPGADPHIADPHSEHEPAVAQVTLVSVGDREVLVRLADGRTGVIDRADFDDAGLGSPAEGSDLAAAVLQREYPDGRVPMSAKWAARTLGWARVTKALETGEVLTGTVERSIKGGFVVRVGIPAFMPQSLVGEVEGKASELVGTEVEVVVKEVDRFADRVVVSRRDPQRRARRAAEREQYSELSAGQRHSGQVTEVLDVGAKVRIGGLVGLVHRSELSWGRVGHPRDVVAVGDAVEVEVLEVVRSKRRIKLSIKRTTPHPFDSVTVGDTYPAVIQRVLEYGAIAELAGTGAVGLIHRNELSSVPGQRPDQIVVPGEEIQVKVLSVDPEKDRMALSAVQATYL